MLKGEDMEGQAYITDKEQIKCRRIVDAFGELYERTDTIIVDAGKYGFVKLQYYKPHAGFDSAVTYTDSQSMFNDLWDEWLCNQLLTLVWGTPLQELGYEEIFDCLPKERQEELMAKQIYFKERSGVISIQNGEGNG